MDNFKFNLEKYLEYINADISNLSKKQILFKIVNHHVMKIPYQSFCFALKEPVIKSLEIKNLFEDLIDSKSGGMCYQTCELLYHALKNLKYDVIRIEGFEKTGDIFDLNVPSSHNLLLIKLEEKSYIADVGWGYNSPRFPIDILDKEVFETNLFPGDTYEIVNTNTFLDINLKIKGENKFFYRVNKPFKKITYEQTLKNYLRMYTDKYNLAIRDEFILVGFPTVDGRIGIYYDLDKDPFNAYHIQNKNGTVKKNPLISYSEVEKLVENLIGIKFPSEKELKEQRSWPIICQKN